VGSSPDSLQQAIRNGVARAGQTLRNLEWFEVTEIRGQVEDGAVAHFQVGLKVGFWLDAAD
jgi:flavin-binding protein dodecin